jgi:peptidase M28-like protein
VKVWLVAHYDSKGQPISMAVRLVGFLLLVLGFVMLALNAIAAIVVLVLGLVIVLQNRVTDSSPGALDNASAVIAVLMAVDQLPREAPVGIIFPDAEEYGLVGARALASDRAALFRDAAIVNLDGIDDAGRSTVFIHRRGPVSEAVARALEARRWRWLPVVVDGIALGRVARECVTILKGNVRTMLIVHTPQDVAARVRLDGAANVAAGLARVLRQP